MWVVRSDLSSGMTVCSWVRTCGPDGSTRNIDDFLDNLSATHHSPLEASHDIRIMPNSFHLRLASYFKTKMTNVRTPQPFDRLLRDALLEVHLAVDVARRSTRQRVRAPSGDAEAGGVERRLCGEPAQHVQ